MTFGRDHLSVCPPGVSIGTHEYLIDDALILLISLMGPMNRYWVFIGAYEHLYGDHPLNFERCRED